MLSARVRLTILFAGACMVTAIALATVLWLARAANAYRELAPVAFARADMATGLIQVAAERKDTILGTSKITVVPTIVGPLKQSLDLIPDYVVVVDTAGQSVYWSAAVRRLDDEHWRALRDQLLRLPTNGPAAVLSLDQEALTLASDVPPNGSGLLRVVVGVPTAGVLEFPREYLLTLFLTSPIIVALATWGAYRLLGGYGRQMERITTQVAAITDGRSLHRRLADEDTDPELLSIVDTVNAMIARLETSFQGLRRFTADASHELKTPLTVLRADVERAMSEGTSKAERMVALEEALHEITRMSNLVESLLTLARADEGRFDLHRESVDLGALVQDVYETAVILGEAAGVQVTLPFNVPVVVFGDRIRLRQLFLNLITNAIKYTPRGGRIDIGLGRHADHITFAVRDTGIGIAAADLPHIFDRFWRADRVRSRAGGRREDGDGLSEAGSGVGLGLAISQWIAQAHGGSLTVSSRLGQGSIFTVTLPVPTDEELADGSLSLGRLVDPASS